jgi:hypothetical protein
VATKSDTDTTSTKAKADAGDTPITVDSPDIRAAVAAGNKAALTPEEVEAAGYFGVSPDTNDPELYTLAGESKRRALWESGGSPAASGVAQA